MTILVGRDAETAQLGVSLSKLVSGRGGIAWIEGEPGIGKSAMADELTRAAARAGCQVLRGSGDELMRSFPLRMIADAFDVSARSADTARAEIARLLRGELVDGVAFDPVLAAGERVLDLVDRATARQPVLLVLEDLHWADEPSLLLCHRMARAVDQIPLLMVFTSRPPAARTTVARLRALLRERPGVHLDLGPLSPAATLALATGLVEGAPGPRLVEELDRAGGNPLYLREMLEAMLRDGALERTGDVYELRVDADTVPPSLLAAIGRRLDALSEPTVVVLRLAALLRREFDLAHWAEVSGRPVTELAAATQEAITAGVLADTGERLTFRHDVLRQALADQLPEAVRAGLHRHAARMLADADAGLDEVSPHLAATAGPLDAWALTWLAGLPECRLQAAAEVSADLLARATAQSGLPEPVYEALLARYALTLFWLGRDERACEVAVEVLRRTTDQEFETRLRILAVRAAGRSRRFTDALQLAEPSSPDLPLRWQARLRSWRALILLSLGRFDEGSAQAHQALAESESCADPLGVSYAHNALAFVAAEPDQLHHIDAALASLDQDVESADLKQLLTANRLFCVLLNGPREEYDKALTLALRCAETAGSMRAGVVFAEAAYASYMCGRWDDAVAYADRPDQELLTNPTIAYVHAVVALVAMHRDDRATAEARLNTGGFLVPADRDRWISASGPVAEALAMLAELRGDPAGSLAVWARYLELPPGTARSSRCVEAAELVRVALAQGDLATAYAALAPVTADPDPSPLRALVIRCCQAMVARDPAELIEVAADYGRWDWPRYRARALEEAAVLLAARGDLDDARAVFADALNAWLDLGAAWDARRVEARLRPSGVRRGPRTVRRRATHGWEALTPSERHVARLVAKGLSNPDIAAELFVSRNTVQTHVSRVLSKLQMRSRIELVQQADTIEQVES
ncbi:LuxR family transcriptional regulator [Catellatospora coxensis]|uniref:helix-turn-helix transcriptional regulator n=1 Tax=Catellatospora coxensis TaxID=310354 RepID=UPI0031E04448